MSSPDSALEIEFPYFVEAILIERKLKILVKDIGFQDQLRNKGFGEKQDSEYILQPYEALYLIHTKRLVLNTKKVKHIDFESLLNIRKLLKILNLTNPLSFVSVLLVSVNFSIF